MSEKDRGSSASTQPAVTETRWSSLSELGQATARRIALPRSLGWTLAEISKGIGITQSSAQQLLDELATELEQQPNANGNGSAQPDS
jgi:DNA-binding MarR family transcriptional regulator